VTVPLERINSNESGPSLREMALIDAGISARLMKDERAALDDAMFPH